MIKEIAVFSNKLGDVADLNENGVIKIFSKIENQWKVIRELSFKINSTKEKEDIRGDILNIMEVLGNCKIFIAREFSELAYVMLDSMGFSTWKMEGNPDKFLEYILEKEEQEAEEIKLMESSVCESKQSIEPMPIGNNDYYILNLKDLQEYNTGVSTKQALRPFLNKENFNELIVTCSHVPNWLESELVKLNLNIELTKTGQNDYIIIINKKLK